MIFFFILTGKPIPDQITFNKKSKIDKNLVNQMNKKINYKNVLKKLYSDNSDTFS